MGARPGDGFGLAVGYPPPGRRATLWRRVEPLGAALPLQHVARTLYLHQHLVLRRRQILKDGFPGLRPYLLGTIRHVWQDPVLEPLNDERGFLQLPRDGAVPAVAGERRRAVEAGRVVWVITSPLAPHGVVLQSLLPDLVPSAWDDTTGARYRLRQLPEVVRPSPAVHRQREGRGSKRIHLLGRSAEERVYEHHTAHHIDDRGAFFKLLPAARVARVKRPPDVLPADRVAHQDDLVIRGVRALDGVLDDLVDVAYPDVGACKAEVARVGPPLLAERIDPE